MNTLKRVFLALILFSSSTYLFPDENQDVFKDNGFIQQTLKQYGAEYMGDMGSYLIYNYDYDYHVDPYIPGSAYRLPAESVLKAARTLSSTTSDDRHAFVLDPGVLAIAANTAQFDLLKAICTGYLDTSMDEISSYLHKWESNFSFRIIGIGHQFIILDILSGSPDYASIARDVNSFCPGVVKLGTHTVANLADQIRRTGSIYLWWTYNYRFVE